MIPGERKKELSKNIDLVLTHPLLAFPIFSLVLFLMFLTTFWLGGYPAQWLNDIFKASGNFVSKYMADGMLKDLMIDGLIGGVGGVLVFIPNILILFAFIGLMEDSGYLARVVYFIDQSMHRFGLHGRSFIPLIIGFSCNVPAIMSTRNITNRQHRLITMFIMPFMSCSARLPVYILFCSAFFPRYTGLVCLLLYLTGVLLGLLTALVLRKTVMKDKDDPYEAPLPPYRFPSIKTLIRQIWIHACEYLKKIGGIILVASVLIWALGYFPVNHPREDTYIGRIGKSMEPFIAPLGFDWEMGVGLLSGVVSKEIVVSTLGVLYPSEGDSKSAESISERLKNQAKEIDAEGKRQPLTPIVAFAFMLFSLLYFPCIATTTMFIKESGSWLWGVGSVLYNTGLAWMITFIFVQGFRWIF